MRVRATEELTGVRCLGYPLSKSFSGLHENPHNNIMATNEAVVLGAARVQSFFTPCGVRASVQDGEYVS